VSRRHFCSCSGLWGMQLYLHCQAAFARLCLSQRHPHKLTVMYIGFSGIRRTPPGTAASYWHSEVPLVPFDDTWCLVPDPPPYSSTPHTKHKD